MQRYQAVVLFHAENDADATEQVNRALECFDDGYQRVALREMFSIATAPARLVFIEGEDHKRVTPD